jgi:uncharacterized protein (DUF736 family)
VRAVPALCPSIAIEAAIGRPQKTAKGNQVMAIIGSFIKSGNSFMGALKTPTLNVKATIRAVDKANDKAPDFRIFAGTAEFGAGWTKVSQEGRAYLSVKLDDPSFPAPIYATLVEAEDGTTYNLIWSRRNGE